MPQQDLHALFRLHAAATYKIDEACAGCKHACGGSAAKHDVMRVHFTKTRFYFIWVSDKAA